MNCDTGYAKNFFDAWNAGFTDAELLEELGIQYRTYYDGKYIIPANHGFSKEICSPPIPKANMPKETK